jgi:glycosyltransferase involved in cell wall biosynthesis
VRVLFVGDSAASGFGTVTWDLGTRLLKLHDVRFVSQNDTGEPIPEPIGPRTYSVQAIHPAAAIMNGFRDGWKPEACIILGDYFLTRAVVGGSEEIARAFGSIPTLHYCPIEGVDLPPSWDKLWKIVRPVAMSEFGADQIEKVMGVRPPCYPHGVDSDVFRPISFTEPLIVTEREMAQWRPGWKGGDVRLMSKGGAKALFGLNPNQVLALRTDRNMPRKLYSVLYRAMAPAMTEVPNLALLVHCRTHDQGGNLFDLSSKYPESVQERMMFTGAHDTFTGLPRSLLVALYNAADLYVSTSAEGFGLTIAEAMACGVPAVAMDYSAVSEVVGDAGKLVPIDHLIDNEYDHSWATVNEPLFTAAVVRLATHASERRELGAMARARILSRYRWDDTAEGFSSLIEAAVKEPVDVRP